jgi:hypothetical protein
MRIQGNGFIILLVLLLMADLLKDAGYNQYLTKVENVSVQQTSEINSTPVQNLQSGGLTTDLVITKSGEVIPSSGDWNYVDVSKITYVADNILLINDRDFFDRVRVGDKIRCTQTTEKWFYVWNKQNGQILLTAGKDYTLNSDAITSLAFSSLPNPETFPSVFRYDSTLSASGSMTVTDQGADSNSFFIVGRRVFVTSNHVAYQLGGTASMSVYETLPLAVETNPLVGTTVVGTLDIGGTEEVSTGTLLLIDNTNIIIRRLSGNFTLATNTAHSFSYSYIFQAN